MDTPILSTDMQAISKVIQAVLLQVDFLSDCGLDVCVAVAAHKRVQFWSSRTWRGDLTEAMKTAANHQADLDEDNNNVDMFVEMKSSQAANRLDLMHPDNETDVSPAPVTPPHDIVPQDQTSGTWTIQEFSIQPELVDFDQNIPEADDGSCLDGELPPAPITSLHDVLPENHATESYVVGEETIKSESVDAARIEVKVDGNNSCMEGDVSHREEPPVTTSGRPREYTESEGTGKKYRCTECPYTTYRLAILTLHQLAHREQTRQCSTDRDSLLTRPITTVSGDITPENYNSVECRFGTASSHHARDHTRLSAGEKLYHCKLWNYKVAQLSNLQQHERRHTGDTFNCEHCDYKSNFKHNLLIHMRRHTGDTFNCEHCEYKATRKCDMAAHMRKHTGETFNCEHCDYKSTVKCNLRTHLRKHTGETFNCERCEYKSNLKHNLLIHMRKHTGETFNCEHCEYKATRKYDMVAHMRKHTGRTFNCEHCDYKSTVKCNLRTHLRKHTGETFNCERCEYKSNLKHNLLIHMRKHTGDTFNCEHCDYKCLIKNDLHRHRKKHHSDILESLSELEYIFT